MIFKNARSLVVASMVLCVVVPPAAAQQKNGQAAAQAAPAAGTIKSVRFAGNHVISSETLDRTVQSAPGQAYDAAVVTEDIARVQKLYASRGWTLARVRDAELQPDGTLLFKVMEGVINKINITGNKRTHSRVILDMIELKPGAVYNERIAAADRRRLDDLGVFETIVLEPVPAEEPGKVNLNVKVKERRTIYLSGAAAYSGSSGLVGYFDGSDTNFLGNGQTVRFQWQRGISVGNTTLNDQLDRRSAYELSFDDPRLFRHRLTAGFDVYHKETLFTPVFNSLDLSARQFEFREGATLRLGTALSAHTESYIFYKHDRVNYDEVPATLLTPAEIAGARGTVTSLGLRGVLNHRDRDLNPHRGHYEDLRMEFGDPALGGSFQYNKVTLDARGYLPAGRGTFAGRALAGRGSGGTPLSEQYWIGGYELLRGFDFDEFHGTRLALVSGEYRWPIMESIQAALFADSGYAWPRGAQMRIQDMKLGGGLGLRFITPIGPIRLDVAMGSRLHTYLSLGQIY